MQQSPFPPVESRSNIRFHLWLLVGVTIFHIALNSIWIYKDHSPPSWDPSVHLQNSLRYFNAFRGNESLSLTDWMRKSTYYPPLQYILTIPFYYTMGVNEDSGVAVNHLFFCLLIFSTYLSGRALFCERTGLYSALLVSLYPIVFGLSRQYYLDFALMCMVALATYLLHHAFDKPKCAVCCGIVFGAGMLLKWTFIIFVCGPFLYELFRAVRKNATRAFMLGLLIILMGSAIACIWYLPNRDSLVNAARLTGFAYPEAKGRPNLVSFDSLIYYAIVMINQYLFLPCFILFILGLVAAWRKKPATFVISALYIFLPYLIFTLIHEKEVRYMMPVLPIIACFSAFWFVQLSRQFIRNLMISVSYAFLLCQYAFISFGIGFLPVFLPLYTPIGALAVTSNETLSTGVYSTHDWCFRQLLSDVQADGSTSEQNLTFLPNLPSFNQNILHYYRQLLGIPIGIRSYIFPYFNLDDPFVIFSSDYIVMKTGYVGAPESMLHTYRIQGFIAANQSAFNDRFTLLKHYDLPDGSQAMLYRKQPDQEPADCHEQSFSDHALSHLNDAEVIPVNPDSGSVVSVTLTWNPGIQFEQCELHVERGSGTPVVSQKVASFRIDEASQDRCWMQHLCFHLPEDLAPDDYSIFLNEYHAGEVMARTRLHSFKIQTQTIAREIAAQSPLTSSTAGCFPSTFKWSCVPPCPYGFRFEITGGIFLTPYSEKVFQEEYRVPATGEKLNSVQKGTYSWRVFPLSADGSEGQPSEFFTFDLK